MEYQFDVLVVGGGVNGLATAYHLSKHRKLKIGLVEQFSLGHSFGSSHGFTRIFRSTYVNPVYVALAKHAQKIEWPELERDSKSTLLHPHRRCIFGEGASYENYAQSILNNCPDVEKVGVSLARRLFPEFRFLNSPYVLNDTSAATIGAKDTLYSYVECLVKNKVAILENTKVLHINSEKDPIQIRTSKEPLEAKKIVLTAGPWISHFVPQVNFQAIRQAVGYYKLKDSSKSFPLWEYAGEGLNRVFYGLPELYEEGIKVSQEVIANGIDNPDDSVQMDPSRFNVIEEFISDQFSTPFVQRASQETCFYTMRPASDFVLDLIEPRIAIGSACSGHGFKFAPITGKILSELILFGKSSITEFENEKPLFAFKKENT